MNDQSILYVIRLRAWRRDERNRPVEVTVQRVWSALSLERIAFDHWGSRFREMDLALYEEIGYIPKTRYWTCRPQVGYDPVERSWRYAN